MLLSAKLQQVFYVDILRDIHPSGLVNRLGDPKQVTLATSGEGWVEQSPLDVVPFCILSKFNCYLILNMYFCLEYD